MLPFYIAAVMLTGCYESGVKILHSDVEQETPDADRDSSLDTDAFDDPTEDPAGDTDLDAVPALCGNGVLESGEQCDGTDFGGATCESLGYDGGTLACLDGCTIDEDRCGFFPDCLRLVNVNSTAPVPDGLTWASAFATVQYGLDEAYNALLDRPELETCEVWVAEGTYHVFYSSSEDTVRLLPGVEVYGGFSGTELFREERDFETRLTVLDGRDGAGDGNVEHVVTGSDMAVIDGFVITGGNGTSGGGMLNDESSPTVANCTFLDNWANEYGGGMANFEGSPVVTGCTFSGNIAGYMGGGISGFNASPVVSDCAFYGNRAQSGGGIGTLYSLSTVTNCIFSENYAYWSGGGMDASGSGTSVIRHCTFSDNYAGNYGGGLQMASGDYIDSTVEDCTFLNNTCRLWGGGMSVDTRFLAVTNCSFVGNEAGTGGGLYSRDSCPIRNCIFFDNHAGSRGGGLYFTAETRAHTVTNCTLYGNSAESEGGGIYNEDQLELSNSILLSNSPDEIFNGELFGECLATYTAVEGGYPGEGNIDMDPLFADPEAGDFHLLPGSPCIDAANGDLAPAADMEGLARYDDPATPDTGAGSPTYADMGALEYRP